MPRVLRLLAMLGPGILVAATGVGAGDLATATFSGAKLGTAILWAVLVGAALKFCLNEGLARYQLASGSTLLEGASRHIGQAWNWLFLIYLVVWSFLVAMALMNTCGVALHAMFPIFESAETARIVFGAAHSLVAAALIKIGGYRLFEKAMGVCIALMFVVVIITAILVAPADLAILRGLVVPTIPDFSGQGLPWTIALLGGVGGTVTIICYGYWIREKNRIEIKDLVTCRYDLATAYVLTAIFGIAMVTIGSQIGEIPGKGAGLVVNIANRLEQTLGMIGPAARWAFLIGAWAAFFSSLLGVWQSIPYLFNDLFDLMFAKSEVARRERVSTRSKLYNISLLAIAVLPIGGLYLLDFQRAILVYGIVGALFIPILAGLLLWLNGSQSRVGQHKNSMLTTLLLVVTLAFFVMAALFAVLKQFGL